MYEGYLKDKKNCHEAKIVVVFLTRPHDSSTFNYLIIYVDLF